MRLRLAPVEYQVCATAGCGSKYEGARCPRCRQPFDPAYMRKELADRLILVDLDPPVYQQTHRCRCTECKSLFDLRQEGMIAHVQCSQCRRPLFSREQLQKLWKDAELLLQRARKLDRARRRLTTCPHCTYPVPTECWCPLSHSVPHHADASGLPQNPIVVWTRTFHVDESLEELQLREGRDDERAEEWHTSEQETEIEGSEGESDAEP